MDESKTAPRPWTFGNVGSQWTDSLTIYDAEHGEVCHLTRGYQAGPSVENAKLIVEAVNTAREQYLEMQLKIAWDALGDIISQERIPAREQSQSPKIIAQTALELLNDNMIKFRADNSQSTAQP